VWRSQEKLTTIQHDTATTADENEKMANPNTTTPVAIQEINMTIPTTTTPEIQEINNQIRLEDAAIQEKEAEVLRLLRVITETQGDWQS
jgi:hypothetical protein